MKAEELVETVLNEQKSEIVVELQNGQRISTQAYFHDTDKRGAQIIVLKAWRKIERGGG